MKILVVEDEKRLAKALGQILKEQRYLVDVVHTGADGLAYAQSGQYDVMVLDVMLPGLSGLAVAKRLREEKNATPILMLTARDEVADKVQGLDTGADDYMTKPFATEELLARVRALTRRPGEMVHEELGFGDLTLGLSDNRLSCGEKTVHLAYKEFEILKILMMAGTAITSKETLIVKVWGADSDAADNNVEAYISFLRKKLFYLGSHVGIVATRRVGYRLEEGAS
ncbi:MAG: response regulator transcription factor [Oscillospiraceae bacterium]